MRLTVTVAALVLCLAAPAVAQAPAKITGKGVGKVKLGASHASLRDRGLVGPLKPGCPLGGADTRIARLRPPLKGSVSLSTNAARRVRAIAITGGARARGLGVGATVAQIKATYPRARIIRATEEVFGVTLVRVGKKSGGRFEFAVDVDSGKTRLIGVPGVQFCE